MPLLNSMGVMRYMTMFSTVTPISGQQWIAQFSDYGNSRSLTNVTSTGDVFLSSPSNAGILKINDSGVKVFAKTSSQSGSTASSAIILDGSNNVYVGGTDNDSTTLPTGPYVIKYDSSGNILWQKNYGTGSYDTRDVMSMALAPTGDLFVLIGANTGGSPASPTLAGPYVLFKIDSNTGAIINQRKLLKQATSAPSDLLIDSINNNLIVTGTDYSGTHSTILNGIYDFTNTDTATRILIQSSTTDDYESFFGSSGNVNTVTDGTYIYMTGYRIISGITKSVYMKINRTTGAVSYSNSIEYSGVSYTLSSITMDTSGHLYILGYGGGTSPYAIINKINASDGSIVYTRTIGSTINFELIEDIVWANGFLYFVAAVYINPGSGFTYVYAAMKINSDGSLPNGTYATYWTFGTISPTLVSRMPQTTGTTTGANSTTTNTATTAVYTISNDPVTISTTYIP